MNEIDVNRFDLNLLKVFMALYEEGSVTGAGQKLGLAQSSISHALARLRDALGNPLFVRTTTSMQATPYANDLAKNVQQTLLQFQSALDKNREFFPDSSLREFHLIMTDVGEMLFLPKLMTYLKQAAPQVRIRVHQLERSLYRDVLESGDADIALGQLPEGQRGFFQQLLFEEEFACFARNGHPLQNNFNLDSYFEAKHLVVSHPAMAEAHVKRTLGARATQRYIALQVPHYLTAPFVLVQTDLIAVFPKTVSNYFASFGTIVELPLPFEIKPLIMRQFWHERSNHDPGCQWLRRVIASLFLRRDFDAAEGEQDTLP